MCPRSPVIATLMAAALLSAQGQAAERLGIGRAATRGEIAAWDIDVRPDGLGLPAGEGTIAEGDALWAEKCASCHGDFGEGVGRAPALIGGQGTLAGDRPMRTVGSYWPYVSTLYDYTRRAMPYGDARSLTDNETYALTAYILHLNDLVDVEFVLSRESFGSVALPNAAWICARRPPRRTLLPPPRRALHDRLQGRGEDHLARLGSRFDTGTGRKTGRLEGVIEQWKISRPGFVKPDPRRWRGAV